MVTKKELLKNLRNYSAEEIAEAVKAGVVTLYELKTQSQGAFSPLLSKKVNDIISNAHQAAAPSAVGNIEPAVQPQVDQAPAYVQHEAPAYVEPAPQPQPVQSPAPAYVQHEAPAYVEPTPQAPLQPVQSPAPAYVQSETPAYVEQSTPQTPPMPPTPPVQAAATVQPPMPPATPVPPMPPVPPVQQNYYQQEAQYADTRHESSSSSILSFDGRIGRLEYFLTYLISNILYVVISIGILFATFDEYRGINWEVVIGTYFVLNILFSFIILAQGSKRCHDVGLSGWFQLIPFFYIYLFFAPGDDGENKYGDQP